MSTNKLIALDGFATKEIALQQKPINEVLKESEGIIISFTKASVKKNLTALVKKHEKEITELIAKEILTVKEENRLIELRKYYKDSRIALDKITKHNSSVLAQASKTSKVVKDELTLIVEPVEDKISLRLEKEQKRREDAAAEKERLEAKRVEKIGYWIELRKDELQAIITKTKTYESIQDNLAEYQELIASIREVLENKEFDLQEFEVDYETMLTTQSEAFQNVITNLTNAYQLEVQNKALEVQKLTNERMNELFDYDFRYKGEVALGELDLEEYAEILIPERTKFRINELENLGFTKGVDSEVWSYIPNDSIILCSFAIGDIRKYSNEVFLNKVDECKKAIENYQEPTPVNEIEVVENEQEENTISVDLASNTSDKTVEATFLIGTDNKPQLIESKIVEKVVTESVKPNETPNNVKTETPLQTLLKFITPERTRGEVELKIKQLLGIEREMIIDAYNEGQTDTINIVIAEIEKEAPGMIEEVKEAFKGNINKLDAIEYFDQKFS